MTAFTWSPTLRSSASAEVRVMAATTSSPFTSITTSAITPPSFTDFTVPGSWLRALSSMICRPPLIARRHAAPCPSLGVCQRGPRGRPVVGYRTYRAAAEITHLATCEGCGRNRLTAHNEAPGLARTAGFDHKLGLRGPGPTARTVLFRGLVRPICRSSWIYSYFE